MAVAAISSAVAGVRLPALPSQPSPAGTAPLGGANDARIGDGLAPAERTGTGFGDVLFRAIENVQQTQATADQLAVEAATGTLTDVHDYMVAATEASLATELTVAVRNKAVDAFNSIMSMGV